MVANVGSLVQVSALDACARVSDASAARQSDIMLPSPESSQMKPGVPLKALCTKSLATSPSIHSRSAAKYRLANRERTHARGVAR
eukprot:6195782-Pleurochrysis_carterae.AAC.2